MPTTRQFYGECKAIFYLTNELDTQPFIKTQNLFTFY